MPAVEKTIVLTVDDGYPLGAHLYEPAIAAKSTVVLHGATATPQRYYRGFSQYLQNRGHRVLTYDFRGVGESRPPELRGFDADMRDWAFDAKAAHDKARELAGKGPLVMVGHSFGGQLIGLCDELRDVNAALLVGAQLGYYGHWPLAARVRLAGLWNVAVPALTATYGYLPGKFGLGSDLPAGVALEWRRWCLHPSYLMGYVRDARQRFARFDRPSVFYSFTDDDYAPRQSVEKMLAALSSAPVVHRRMAPVDLGQRQVGHFGFFRARFAETLWAEALATLDAVADGRRIPLSSIAPRECVIRDSDVMADFEYGRA